MVHNAAQVRSYLDTAGRVVLKPNQAVLPDGDTAVAKLEAQLVFA